MAADTTIRIVWKLDVQDRGAGAKLLAQDRQIRTSLRETDTSYTRMARTAASTGDKQASAASRTATALKREGGVVAGVSAEMGRYAAAQREALTIGSRIVGQADKVTGAYSRQAAAAKAAHIEQSRLSKIGSGGSGAARKVGTVVGAAATGAGALRGALSTAGVGVGLAGFAGIGAVVKETISFDRALRNVNSIAQLSERRLQVVGKSLRELGGKTAQAPKTLAEGMYDLVSSGFKAKDALSIVGTAARAATAGLTTTDVSTKAVAAVLNAYHLSAKAAAGVSDTLFQTVNLGVVTFSELAEHIGTVLPFASSLGVKLKEVGASISTMTKQGISGELSITFLKNAMVSFLKPSEGMKTAIKKTGEASSEALIKHKGFEGALQAVIKTTDGSKKSVAALFPNIRALTAALALTGKNSKSAASDLQAFGHTGGATGKALAQQAQSVSYKWNQLKATFSGLAITLGNKFVPAANEALGALSDLLNPKTTVGGAVHDLIEEVKRGFRDESGSPTTKPERGGPVQRTLTTPIGPTGVRLTTGVGPRAPGAGVRAAGGGFGEGEGAPLVLKPEKSVSEFAKVGHKIAETVKEIGQAAQKYGGQLLEAFKPAQPFFQNVLLPVIEGIGTGVTAAFVVAIPIVNAIATALGAVGKALGPLSPAFKIIGGAIGVFLAGPILGLLGKLPKVGLLFRAMGAPVKLATGSIGLFGKALSGLGGVATRAGTLFDKLPGRLGRVAGGVTSAAGRLATSAGRGISGIADLMGGKVTKAGQRVVSNLGSFAGKLRKTGGALASAAASGVASIGSKIGTALSTAVAGIPWKAIWNKLWTKGTYLGSAIQAGVLLGLAALAVVVGKKIKEAVTGWHVSINTTPPFIHLTQDSKTSAAAAIGPGHGRKGGRATKQGFRRYAQGGLVDAMVSPGEAIVHAGSVWTVPGARTAADSVFAQLPVGAAVLTSSGQQMLSRGASLNDAIAYQAPHFAKGGFVSTAYGPPWGGSEGTGTTATGIDLHNSPKVYIVAVDPSVIPLHSKLSINPNPFGYAGNFAAEDTGGAIKGNRIDFYDWKGRADQNAWGRRSVTVSNAGKGGPINSAGGSAKVTQDLILGRSRTRAGLVPDAFSQGVEAGLAGLTPGEVRRANRGARGARVSPIVSAIAGAYGAVTRALKTSAAKRSSGKAGHVILTAGANMSVGREPRIRADLGRLAGKLGKPVYVISGYRTPKHSVEVGGFANDPHTRGEAADIGVGSASRASMRGVSESTLRAVGLRRPFYPQDAKEVNHVQLLRRGGIAGFARGGVNAAVNKLQSAGGNTAKIEVATTSLDEAIGKLTVGKLNALVLRFRALARKGGKANIVKSFQSVIDEAEFAIGQRIGNIGDKIAQRTSNLERSRGAFDRGLRRAGTDPASGTGLTATIGFDDREKVQRERSVKDAERAKRIADKSGNKDKIKEATEALHAAQDELDESVVKGIEDARSLLAKAAEDARNAAQETSDTAAFGVSSAQNSLAGLDIAQRLSRTNETPGGLTQKAAAIEAKLIPMLQASLGALNSQLGVLRATGASEAEIQAVLTSIQTEGNEIGNAMAEAAELIRHAAEEAAEELVEKATHKKNLGQIELHHKELQERIDGTFDTSGQQNADFIRNTIIPSVENEIAALRAQWIVAVKEGNTKLAEQIAEEIGNEQNGILEDILQANEDVAGNTDPKHKVGGTLGFAYGGETLTDAIIGVGSGVA